MEYQHLLSSVESLVLQVGAFQKFHFGKVKVSQMEEKMENDWVSFVDKTTEIKLVQGLKEILPSAAFVTEEGTTVQRSNESTYWIIDPLDGTTNFLFGIPLFSISVALVIDNVIVLGVVYNVMSNELHSTALGFPTYLNGQVVAVSERSSLKKSIVVTGFPYDFKGLKQQYMEVFDQLVENTAGMRRLGSAAIDMAYVSCGRCDVFFEWGLKPWDVAAGIILVQNAGGKVMDFKGDDNALYGSEMIAGNPLISSQLLDICKKVYYPFQ